MDCSWVKNISKRRPIQPAVFYDNKKGTFDAERVCLGLSIDEIHYSKLLEYITVLINQAGNSRHMTRDIRRHLKKKLDPILHNLPSAWVAKCIDQMICNANSNLANAKRQERTKAMEPRKDLPQNQESRYSVMPSPNIHPDQRPEFAASIMSAPNHTAWPTMGYPANFHPPYDPTQFSGGRLVSSGNYDQIYPRNPEGIAEELIRPGRVDVKREYEPEDPVIGRSIRGYVVSRDPAEQNHHAYRATADRYIPDYGADRFATQSSFPFIGPIAPESGAPQRQSEPRASGVWAPQDGVPERRMEQRVPGLRTLEEKAPERRIEEQAPNVLTLQEGASQKIEEQIPEPRISEEKASDQLVGAKALILRSSNLQKEEKALILRSRDQLVEGQTLIWRDLNKISSEKQSEQLKVVSSVSEVSITENKTSDVQVSKKKFDEWTSNELAVEESMSEQQAHKTKKKTGRRTLEEKAIVETFYGVSLPNSGQGIEPGGEHELPQDTLTKNPGEQDNYHTEISSGESVMTGLEFSSQKKTAKRGLINEIAFMARRGTTDWILLGTGDDLLGSSGAPDWDIFLSRLKAGLEFSLENDRLFCPWLSYTNGEELVGIFDAFGWRAGIGNMLRRGLREFRFEVKKQGEFNQLIRLSTQELKLSDAQPAVNEEQLDRSSSLSSLDSYNDE